MLLHELVQHFGGKVSRALKIRLDAGEGGSGMFTDQHFIVHAQDRYRVRHGETCGAAGLKHVVGDIVVGGEKGNRRREPSEPSCEMSAQGYGIRDGFGWRRERNARDPALFEHFPEADFTQPRPFAGHRIRNVCERGKPPLREKTSGGFSADVGVVDSYMNGVGFSGQQAWRIRLNRGKGDVGGGERGKCVLVAVVQGDQNSVDLVRQGHAHGLCGELRGGSYDFKAPVTRP